MKFPFERYRYYKQERADGSIRVIAISTYAGKTVRGVATCAPGDIFDVEFGKRLAALRCARKIAEKRIKRATECCEKANFEYAEALAKVNRMQEYLRDAEDELDNIDYEFDVININDRFKKL